jgi:hypothetical protein
VPNPKEEFMNLAHKETKLMADIWEIVGDVNGIWLNTIIKNCKYRPYIGIYTKKRNLAMFLYYYDNYYLQAVIPDRLTPELVNARYGISGNIPSNKLNNHYYMDISITNASGIEMICGFRPHEKKEFFLEIANGRA